MSNLVEALPQPIDHESIQSLLRNKGLPEATKIASAKVTAEYHSIYFITVPPCEKTLGHSDLVLRVSGPHLPTIKTRNEIGVMSWVAQNTTIPIPDIIAYDASDNNLIGHEYTLLEKCPGATLSDVYLSLDYAQMTHLMDQIIDMLLQLHEQPWEGIGGLTLNESGNAVLSQVLDEDFWQVTDIERFWTPEETVATLNIHGPYKTYIDYVSAQIRQYVSLIKKHRKLEFMLDVVPRLEAFVVALPQHTDELNKTKLRLAHKDMHLANLLFDEASGNITAVLDWEFSGVVPFTRWNPKRAFLWNGRDDDKTMEEKQRLWHLFSQRCDERKVSILEDAEFASPLQEKMQTVTNYLRAIVEVCPRGQRQDLVQGWKNTVLENLAPFSV